MDKTDHLFGSTDRFTFGDLRNRVPIAWDVLCNTLGNASDGTSVYEHLKDIDVLSQRGQVLVDGNHLFLHSLRIGHYGIETWNKHARKAVQSMRIQVPEGHKCPFEPVSPRLLSYIAAHLVHRSIDLATEAIAKDIASSETRLLSTEFSGFVDPDWIVENVDASSHTVLENDWEIISCDALLPDQKYVVERVIEMKQRNKQNSKYLDWQVEVLKSGQFIYWVGDSYFKEDFSLKNDYISDLNNNYFASHKVGVKKLRFAKSSNPVFAEKQVDVLLTMAMCDAAASKALDWVCVVTNDSDYVPAIERLIQAGKKVVWLCADAKQNRSKELLSVVSHEYAFCIDDLFGRCSDQSSKLFMTLFGIPGMARSHENLMDNGTEDPERLFSGSPWEKSYNEFQEEFYQEMERELRDLD